MDGFFDSRRFAHGTRAEIIVERPTGEHVILGEPHWYATATCDQYPNATSPTTADEHYVVLDTSALAAWFRDDAEILS